MKAAEIEDAQKAEIVNLQEDRDAEASAAIANAAIGDIFGSKDIKSVAERDTFYPADRFWQVAITLGLGSNALLAYASDDFLQRLLPSFVLTFRNHLTPKLLRSVFNWAAGIHLMEASVTLVICLKRNWYSPINVLKWTGSTLLYGGASTVKLLYHGKLVERASKKND